MPPLAPIYRYIGNRIRVLRRARQLTQEKLAEAINRTTEYVGKVERGEKRVQLEDLGKAVAAVGVSFSEFFQGVIAREVRGRRAREKPSRYELSGRVPPSPDDVATLTQMIAMLEHADVAALITVAQRMLAAGLPRR